MNHSPARPVLPGTTPAPGPAGLKNVYAGKSSPHMESHSTPQFHAPIANDNNQRALLEKTVNKIVSKLPFQLRESVTAVITMAMTSAENVQKDLDICYHEIAVLRNDLNKKNNEAKMLHKNCNLYQERVRSLEENVEVLRDNVNARQKFSIKNKSAMTRLSSTNRMLIDALDALQNSNTTSNPGVLLTSKSQGNLDIEDRDRPGLLLPISKNKATKDMHHLEYEETEKKVSMFQNDKLRESLLRVAREHYRSMKNSELLDAKVIELRAALRAQEQANRKLKSELDEVKILMNADGLAVNTELVPSTESTSVRNYQFGSLDNRFQSLIDRNAFDPIDGIQLLRRLQSHAATAPSNLNLHSTLLHIASRDTLKIFECDMVCLFIRDPIRENILLRYTVKSPLPEEININETTCVAAEVIKSSKVARINVVGNNPLFNPLVDCCTGVIVKRLLCLPIYDADTSRVFGCIHIVNKSRNDLFSEIDEIFGMLYADQASLLITSCMRYDGMCLHATMLQHLLEASTAVFSVIPDPDSLVSTRPLQPEQILTTIETLAREILKCPNTRAFLVSDFAGLPPGELVLLEHVNKAKALSLQACITMPLHSGIAGHVIETGMMYKLENDKFDPYINPLVDIDPLDRPLITVPIVDLHGTVVGCLQLVVGPRSPKLRESEDSKGQQGLLFVQAAQWLTHQIAAPVQYLIKFIGNTVNRPVSTPSSFTRRGPKPDFFMTGLESMMLNNGTEQEHFRPLTPSPNTPGRDYLAVNMSLPSTAQAAENKPSTPGARVTFADAAELDAIQAERDSLQQELEESRNEVQDLCHKLSEVENSTSTAPVLQSELEQTIASLEAEISALKQNLEAKSVNDAAVAALDSALASQMAAEASVSQVQEEMQALRTAHEAADIELAESREHIASLSQQIENLEAYAATHHRADDEEVEVPAAAGSGAADTQGDSEEQIRVACDAVRESVTQEWKESYESLEQSYNAYKTYADTQQAENDELKGSVTTLQGQVDELTAQVTTAQSEKETTAAEMAALKEQVAKLTATITQKDSVQALLQAQVVKLAGQNIKAIDTAMSSATASASATTLTLPDAANTSAAGTIPSSKVVPNTTPITVSSADKPVTPTQRPSSKPPTPSSGRHHSRPPSGRPPSSARAGGASSSESNAVAAAAGDLASMGWTEHIDDYQRTYYYHAETGESSWGNPALGEVRRGEWVQTFDESGQMYWVHAVTAETSWEVTEDGEPVEGAGADLEDEEEAGAPVLDTPGIFDTMNSQYSATAGDYTIEL